MRQRYIQVSNDMQEASVKHLFTKSDRDHVKDAVKKAKDIHESHENLMKSMNGAKNESEKQQRSQRLSNSQNAFTNFIKSKSEFLHTMLERLKTPKVSGESN